jgi:hypothetical protein
VNFNFADASIYKLETGARLLLVKNPAAMTARYGTLPNLAGTYTGSLSNGGQTLRLEDSAGTTLFEFAFNDRWYPATDGMGFTLVRRNLAAKVDREAWGPSSAPQGSPGQDNPIPGGALRIVVNEALANSEPPMVDSIELLNLSSGR